MEILTMTDLAYLPQTLTMHRSLMSQTNDFTLTVLCMDAVSLAFLRARSLAHTEVLALEELERADLALLATRERRSWIEYCWTAIPALCSYRLASAASGSVLMWADSDIGFCRDPHALLNEIGDGSVLLTPHAYRRAYPSAMPAQQLTARYGRFNGGTIMFRSDSEGRLAAELWRERTIEWCRDECEPGRFGNQVHLDDFPERFAGVRTIGVPGGILGPWNGPGFSLAADAEGPTADGLPVIAYHYQSLRLRLAGARRRAVPLPNVFRVPRMTPAIEARAEPHYRLTTDARRVFWEGHVRCLAESVADLLENEPQFASTLLPAPARKERNDARFSYAKLQSSRVRLPRARTIT
jgi:hypothetical protein